MSSRGPEPRAQFNVHVRERAFEAPAEPRLRAAEHMHPAHRERPAALLRDFHPRAEHSQRAAAATPLAEPRHLQIAMAQRAPAGHGGGGAGHGGPPPQNRREHGH